MADIKIELWSREKFTVANPVCDLCSKPLTDFPAIVVHQPFDYILMRFKDERLAGGYIMRGGMAMCSKCFLANLKEYLKRGDKIIIDLGQNSPFFWGAVVALRIPSVSRTKRLHSLP